MFLKIIYRRIVFFSILAYLVSAWSHSCTIQFICCLWRVLLCSCFVPHFPPGIKPNPQTPLHSMSMKKHINTLRISSSSHTCLLKWKLTLATKNFPANNSAAPSVSATSKQGVRRVSVLLLYDFSHALHRGFLSLQITVFWSNFITIPNGEHPWPITIFTDGWSLTKSSPMTKLWLITAWQPGKIGN